MKKNVILARDENVLISGGKTLDTKLTEIEDKLGEGDVGLKIELNSGSSGYTIKDSSLTASVLVDSINNTVKSFYFYCQGNYFFPLSVTTGSGGLTIKFIPGDSGSTIQVYQVVVPWN